MGKKRSRENMDKGQSSKQKVLDARNKERIHDAENRENTTSSSSTNWKQKRHQQAQQELEHEQQEQRKQQHLEQHQVPSSEDNHREDETAYITHNGSAQEGKKHKVGPQNANFDTSTPTFESKKSKARETKKKTSAGGSPSIISTLHPDAFTSIQPPLSAGILQYLHHHQFHTMTPVQAATLPHFLTHKDVAVQAVTGSGKTLAFLIPCIEMILRRTGALLGTRQVGALILSPTRELAQQTYQICCELCEYVSLASPLLLVGGGGPVTEDLRLFQQMKSDIVIGTPGRVEDVLTRYSVMDMSELECLVLDEADVLLDMGFDMTLQRILSQLPKMRRTGLFSATGTAATAAAAAVTANATAAVKTQRRILQQLAQKAGMRNPVWIHVAIASSVDGHSTTAKDDFNSTPLIKNQQDSAQLDHQHVHQATPSSLMNYYVITPLDEKLSRLVAFLESHRQDKIIVFFLTCACVEFYGKAVQKLWKSSSSTLNASTNMTIELLHGKMVQKRRECAVERFRKSITSTSNTDVDESEVEVEQEKIPTTQTSTRGGAVLFSTDVASRGLDITDVDWVVQFDAPQGEPSSYVHRVGRCARAGRTGSSLLFLTPKEDAYVDLLRMRQVPLVALPNNERCAPPAQVPVTDSSLKDAPESTLATTTTANETRSPRDADSDDLRERIIISASDPTTRILDVLPKIREFVLTDRDLLEKGTKAFTSYIRAYKDHHCSFIFRFASLDLGILATSFCLLRLPKMPELRDQLQKIQKKFRSAGPEIDIHAIPFLDKVREEARQKRLAAILAAGGKNAKQIKAEQRQAARLKKEQERRQMAIAKGRNPDKKRGRNARIMDEWDELAKEERLYKKLRRGKISKDQYRQLMCGDGEKAVGEGEQGSSGSDTE